MDYFLNNLEETESNSTKVEQTNLDKQDSSSNESPSEDALDTLLVEFVTEQF